MDRSLPERWADTTAFRVLLALSACAVLPVLGIGVLLSAAGGFALLAAPQRIEAEHVAVGLLSLGGVLGMIGYVRSRLGVPARHGVTAILVLLAAGIATAAAAAVYTAVVVAEIVQMTRWPEALALILVGGLFGAANAVWALAGIGWSQGLLRRYAESTGRPFDTLPVVLLSVAIVLATAAALGTAVS